MKLRESKANEVADAIRKAMGWGYRNVFWFRGGWKEWTDKRLPVITD